MNDINVFLEFGKKKIFAGGVDWPGWCRSGREEEKALQALFHYGPRYAHVLRNKEIEFQIPADVAGFVVTERHEGNATTDFGAPAVVLDIDRKPIAHTDFEHFKKMLQAFWWAFDRAVEQATGKELRKGPRGGGRDLDKIIDHVVEADRGYLTRLAWKQRKESRENQTEELARTRGAILGALEDAVDGKLPERGPRGGIIWPARYFIRRVAWHVLDHTWEIEDRIL